MEQYTYGLLSRQKAQLRLNLHFCFSIHSRTGVWPPCESLSRFWGLGTYDFQPLRFEFLPFRFWRALYQVGSSQLS